MTVTRSPATPDPLVLLCIMGRAVRGAEGLNVLMQLMVICGLCPSLRHAMLGWLLTEERYAHLEFQHDPGLVTDERGGLDGLYRGFMTPKGRVVLWRHVTRFGLAVMIPVVTGQYVRPSAPAVSRRCTMRARVSGVLSFSSHFSPVLAALENCAEFVTIS